MKPLIAFRADASAQIGTGHIMRCLSLATALRDGGADILFVCRDLGNDVAVLVRAQGFTCEMLPRPAAANFTPSAGSPRHAVWAQVDCATDVQDTLAALQGRRPAWVIVDHYAFDACWHEGVREVTECCIAAIDDLADRGMNVEVLIDHNYAEDHQAKYATGDMRIGRILGGPRYAMLGSAYRNLDPLVVKDTINSIGVFLGGVDADNLSSQVLYACRNQGGFAGRISIATTSANPNLDALTQAVTEDGNAALLLDQKDLASFFTSHDVQIGAGGGATWERCRAGTPSILMQTADNQAVVVQAASHLGFAIGLPRFDPDRLGQAVAKLCGSIELRRTMAHAASWLVDGRGCERIACLLLREGLSVRPIRLADGETMHRWRNAPETRAVSRGKGEIALEDHMAWLADALNAPDDHLLMGEIGAIGVGIVRFHREQADSYEVSIYLDPALHGLGLGGALLAAGEAYLAERSAVPVTITAETMPENARSQSLFRAAGYHGDLRFTKTLKNAQLHNEGLTA